MELPLSMDGRILTGPSSASPKSKACQDQPAEGSSGAPAAERDFEAMKKGELRMAAKALGVRQKNFNVAQLKDACKRAVEAAAKRAREEEELEAGRLQPLEAKQDFDAMNQVELRKAAKEFGVSQGGSVAELKAVCKRHVREQPKQKTLMMWMVGNARVVESAAAPPDTNPAHSGAGAVFGAVEKKNNINKH